MTTVSNTGAVGAQVQQGTAYSNPYLGITQASMANDFFGSQAFGSSPYGYNRVQAGIPQQYLPAQTAAPAAGSDNIASAIFQAYIQKQNNPQVQTVATPAIQSTGRPLTVQDYAMATQVANMFAANTPLISPNTNFFQKDMFAQQLIQPRQGLNYCA